MWVQYVLLGMYLTCCVIVGLIIAMLTPSECISNNCRRKANLIVSDLDQNVTPCDNFYSFVCGNYSGLHRDAKLDKSSVWEDIDEMQIRLLVDFLDKSSSKHEDRILRVLKMVYKSCLDDAEIDRQDLLPILRYVELAEGFPLVQGSRWDQNPSGKNRSWDDIEYSTRYAGFKGGHLLDCYVDVQENDDKDKYYIHLTIPSNLELDVSNEDHFFSYVEKISNILNSTDSDDRAKEINETLKFRQDLANIAVRPENCSYPIVIEELESFGKKFDFLSLKPFFANMSPYVTMPTHIVVSYICMKYLDALKTLVEKTPQRIVANYLMIENIIEITSFLPRSMREPYVEFLRKTKDPDLKVESTKKTLCAKAVKSKMSSALSALYIREYFPVYEKPITLMNTLESIKSQVKRMISNLKRLSKKKKRIALEKIDSIKFASPVSEKTHHELTDLTSFRVFYEDLCFIGNTTSTLASYLALQQFKTDKEWELLERPPTVFDDDIDIFSAEITYEEDSNTVVIPMGFAKYPAFDKFWPHYLNSGFGAQVAMAIIEAVSATVQSLEERKCFTAQYNEYVNNHINVNVTDPACAVSNVARSMGVRAAFLAYSRHEEQRFYRERQLQGLQDYSPKQMFFVDFATFLCRIKKEPFKKSMTQGDVIDVPNEYQVNGALRNLKTFAEMFDCPANSYMNPSERCGK